MNTNGSKKSRTSFYLVIAFFGIIYTVNASGTVNNISTKPVHSIFSDDRPMI